MKGLRRPVSAILSLAAGLLIVAACHPPLQIVADRYMDAVERNDAAAMLAAISDDMVMIVDGGPFFHNEMAGKEALQEYLQGNVATGFRLERTGDAVVSGSQVTYPNRFAMEVFREAGVEWINGADVVTVENGKVTRDIWTIDEASIQELAAAFAALEGLTVEKLAGTWRKDWGTGAGVSESSYHEDSTYELVRYIAGSPVVMDAGAYAIDGDLVTLTTSKAHYCKVGEQGVYQVAITDDGKLEMTAIKDSCWQRKPPVDGAFYLEPVVQ